MGKGRNTAGVAICALCALAAVPAAPAKPRSCYTSPQLMGYRSFLPELEETARFADMGIPLRTVFIANTISANGIPYCQYPPVWKGIGNYDFAPVDAQLGDIIKASPKAEFVVMLDLNTPVWFTRQLYYDSYDALTHVAVMPKWRNEVRAYIDALVRYIEKGYGGRVKAYILMCGRTSEWFEVEPRQGHAKNVAWQKWCAARGKDHGKAVPSEAELATAAFEGTIYDPATESAKIDYWRFNSWIVSDAVLDCARATKAASGGKTVGASYGYYMICNRELAVSANLDYERVLASPDFDMTTSPGTYTGRAIGGGTGSMLVAGTARRHGKRFYYSIDAWPHSKKRLSGERGESAKVPMYWKTLEDTIAGNTRNAAFALVHHASFHWFDMWGGFYKDPGVRERIVKLAEIQKRFADDDSAPLADVLIVADPDSAYGRIDLKAAANDEGAACPEGFIPARACGEYFRNIVNRLGVVYDVCSLNDLPHIDLSRFRAVVLSDVWTITPEKAKILRSGVLDGGRTALWVYAPGVSDGSRVDAGHVRRWAGVDFKTPGVSTTDMGGWKSVYAYDYRLLPPETLREILAAAGCHFYTDDMSPVMANDRLLAIHVKTGGERRVHLPRRCTKVVDLIAGRTVAEDCVEFTDAFATPDTKIYETAWAGEN